MVSIKDIRISTMISMIIFLLYNTILIPYDVVILLLSYNIIYFLIFEILTFVLKAASIFFVGVSIISESTLKKWFHKKFLLFIFLGLSLFFSTIFAAYVLLASININHKILESFFNIYMIGYYLQSVTLALGITFIYFIYKKNDNRKSLKRNSTNSKC